MSVENRIMSERKRLADDGEPIVTEKRSVRPDGGGSGLKHNIPETAVDIIGVDQESTAVIDIFDDGYVVTFE